MPTLPAIPAIPENLQIIGIAIAIGLLILLSVAIFTKPFRLLFRFVLNTIGGLIALIVLNFLGGFIGVSLGINWLNAIIVGIFGLPGVGFLLILQWLLLI